MQKISTQDFRKKFLEYMHSNGHAIVPSSRLVPENDPTTLFTGSGMQPMLPYLLGQKHPLGSRIADSQKCFRSQDIEEVGDNRHTTFFEMLGNWSLGDFFKEEQIPMMWKFLTTEVGIPSDRLYFTCFKGSPDLNIPRDTVAAEAWQKLIAEHEGKSIDSIKIGENPEQDGMRSGERIFYYPEKKNWWSRSGVPANMPIGEPGGPDTEMFYDFYPDLGRSCVPNTPFSGEFCHVNCDCGRFIEIGNNVFMEYVRTENGYEYLPQKNVDFGGGLERMVAALNNDSDVFNIDVFEGPKSTIEALSGIKYISSDDTSNIDVYKTTYAYRVILDHLRAATFLVGDEVLPGNKDQMYFVRRLIRRAVRFARNLNVNTNFTRSIVESFIDTYKAEYKVLSDNKDFIINEIEKEETKFRATLEKGIKEFEKIISKLNTDSNNDTKSSMISGEDAFNLLQSFGFPIELTEELAKEKNIKVDMQAFSNLKSEHADASRTASAGKFKGGLGGDGEMEIKYHTATHMLHQALKIVLGESVQQKGSNITNERLRFDFAFERKMTDEEKKQVEDIVNQNINANLSMTREEMGYDEARSRGAIGLFDDKYGDKVSVYSMGKDTTGKKRGDDGLFSIEFCGGPHVSSTGNMGHFKIAKEEAVSAGVRRIKAVLD